MTIVISWETHCKNRYYQTTLTAEPVMNLQTQSVARKQREELETPREQEHNKKSLSVQAVGELRFSKTLTRVFHSGDKYSASTDFHIFTF